MPGIKRAMPRIDVDDLKRRVDIVQVISQTVKLRRSGRQYLGLCPFHANRHTPALVVWPEARLWKCYGACNSGGDVIAFVMRRDGCDFRAACEWLEREAGVAPRFSKSAAVPQLETLAEGPMPPAEAWQRRGQALVEECQRILFSPVGAKALAYLTGPARGLEEATIIKHRLGFHPGKTYEAPERWGFTPGGPPVFLPRGIVLPAFAGGQLWRIKFRLAAGRPKYMQIRRGRPCSVLYDADRARERRVVVFTEGEFDCLLLEQEADDLAGVVTLGAQGDDLNVGLWVSPYLLDAELLLAAYDIDRDEAGQLKSGRGMERLLKKSRRFQVMQVPALQPGDKDITDYWKHGGNLFQWLALERARALATLFPDVATHLAHLQAQTANPRLPPMLRADYAADLSEAVPAQEARA